MWILMLVACLDVPVAEAPADPMRSKPIVTTRHGECRMACRHIDAGEVARVLAEGRLVPERSREEPGQCPSHALEGVGDGGERLRIVFADCADEVKVVTAIDLDTEWDCDCP